MTHAERDLLQIALGALADIAEADDMTEAQRRAKAKRIYDEIVKAQEAMDGEVA